MPNPTYRRFIGIARELGRSTLVSNVSASGTSLTLVSATGFSGTSKVTIYDGALTEVVTASNLVGNVLTVGPLANAHAAGCLVTTVGTASAGPTDYVPVTKFDPKDDYMRLLDQGWRGSMVDLYGMIDGVRHSEISLSSDAFPDTIGYFIASLLGDVVFAGGTPNTHTMAVKNNGDGQGPSYQLTDVYLPNVSTGVVRQYGGVQFSDFTLNFTGDGMLGYDADGQGYASGLVALPTANFSALPPLPAWTGLVTVAGALTPALVDGSITWKRDLDVIHNIDGSPHPWRVWDGKVNVSGKVSVIAEDETWLNYYLNNTQPSLDLNFTTGAGAGLVAINPHFNQIGFLDGAPNAGKDHLEYDLDFNAIPNTTDQGASLGYSPGKFILKNSKATGTYG